MKKIVIELPEEVALVLADTTQNAGVSPDDLVAAALQEHLFIR
jgi:hypothetical protein